MACGYGLSPSRHSRLVLASARYGRSRRWACPAFAFTSSRIALSTSHIARGFGPIVQTVSVPNPDRPRTRCSGGRRIGRRSPTLQPRWRSLAPSRSSAPGSCRTATTKPAAPEESPAVLPTSTSAPRSSSSGQHPNASLRRNGDNHPDEQPENPGAAHFTSGVISGRGQAGDDLPFCLEGASQPERVRRPADPVRRLQAHVPALTSAFPGFRRRVGQPHPLFLKARSQTKAAPILPLDNLGYTLYIYSVNTTGDSCPAPSASRTPGRVCDRRPSRWPPTTR
jgi:hypothetical protein